MAPRTKPGRKSAKAAAKANGSKHAETNGATPQVNGTEKATNRGRPAVYTPELGRRLCERIALREPLTKICEDPEMPSEREVYYWKAKYPEFLHEYARAREHRADARADRIDDYIEAVKAGTLDANAARVMIDAEKWQAGKENAKKYSDRIEARLADANGEPLQVQAMVAVKALVEALPDLGVLPSGIAAIASDAGEAS